MTPSLGTGVWVVSVGQGYNLMVDAGGCGVSEVWSGFGVEFVFDPAELAVGISGEVDVMADVISDLGVRSLVGGPLPRLFPVSDVDLDPGS